jgi:hypothetical protein
MRAWIKHLLIGLTVFSLVWTSTIIVWQSAGRMPTMADIGLYFVAVPLLALMCLWGAARLFRILSPSSPTAPEAPEQAALPADSATPDETERDWHLHILASALRSVHGDDAGTVAEKLSSGETVLELDPHLKDHDGYPVMTARIAALDDAVEIDQIRTWLAANTKPEMDWEEEEIRTMMLTADVVTELAQQAAEHPLLSKYQATVIARRHFVALPSLRLLVMMPEWDTVKRQVLFQLASQRLEQQNWPAEKIQDGLDAASPACEPMQLIDDLCLQAHRQSTPCFAILVAGMSHIGEATIAKWQSSGQLMHASNTNGTVPGEAAAGLLLADAAHSALMQSESISIIHRAAQGHRSKSIDDAGRISADLTTALARDAMSASAINADDIASLISDTDQRANRLTELAMTGDAVLPDLDASSHIKTSAGCGTMGSTAAVMALALAHHKTTNGDAAVLCISNRDRFVRTAVVVASTSRHEPAPHKEQ